MSTKTDTIRILHLAGIETLSLIDENNCEAETPDNGPHDNLAIFNIPVTVADDVGTGFIYHQFKGINNFLIEIKAGADFFYKIPNLPQIGHLGGNYNFFFDNILEHKRLNYQKPSVYPFLSGFLPS